MVQTRSSQRRAVAAQIGTSAVVDEGTLNERTSPGNQATEKQIQQLIDELGAQKAQERADTSSPGKCVQHCIHNCTGLCVCMCFKGHLGP